MTTQHSASATLKLPCAARLPKTVKLQHIDLNKMCQLVDSEPPVFKGMMRLALTRSREHIAAVNRLRGTEDANAQRVEIQHLFNIFNLLHAKNAMVIARRAERHVANSCMPLSSVLLDELNQAHRAVEEDLTEALLNYLQKELLNHNQRDVRWF